MAVIAAVMVTGPGISVAGMVGGDGRDTRAVRLFFVDGEQLVSVDREVSVDAEPSVAAVKLLLDGPTRDERSRGLDTDIPAGTGLVAASVKGDTAFLEFDHGLASAGRGGGLVTGVRDEYLARLAQVTFTATSVQGVKSVEIATPGQAVITLTRDELAGPAPGATPMLAPAAQRTADASTPVVTAASAAAAVGDRGTQTSSAVETIDPKDAKQVQRRLVELSYLPAAAATGVFDDRTMHAVMAFQSWEGLVSDGIVGEKTGHRLARASQPSATRDDAGRWVEVHREKAAVLLVEGGKVVRTVHTSTGQTGDEPPYDTPPGSFRVFAKQVKSWSVPYKTWMPYACYFNGGVAMHGSDAVPPWPASHGCVRLPQVEAPVVYDFVAVGTPVYVY